MNFNLVGNECVLLPEKALWLVKRRMLIIADLHFGKIEHFRKAGIGIPGQANLHTLNKLAAIIDQFEPEKVIFLGDLFHSVMNQSFRDVKLLLNKYIEIDFILVTGNHDIMPHEAYSTLGLSVVDEYFLDNLWLTHEPQDEIKPGWYNLAGHIHPGVRLKGPAKQRLMLPCFYFGQHHGILPAFGYFTGKANIKTDKKSTIFVVTEDKIIHISTL